MKAQIKKKKKSLTSHNDSISNTWTSTYLDISQPNRTYKRKSDYMSKIRLDTA